MALSLVSPFTVDGLKKFLSLTCHYKVSQAVHVFAELRIADRLAHAQVDRGLTIEEILGNDREQWNSQLLYRILRACVSADIVKFVNDDKHFVLTSSGEMMTSNHPSQVRDHIVFTLGPLMTSAYQQLPKMVRGEGTGSGIARVTDGLDLYTLLSQPEQKEFFSVFSGALTALEMLAGNKPVTDVDFGRFKNIADIGGNRGTFLAQILQLHPTVQHGIVLELPHVIDQHKAGEDFISRGISPDRWSFVAGDMYDSATIPSADAYVLKHVLHNYNDEKCVSILSSIRQAHKERKESSASIFIVEQIILSDGVESNWQAHAMDVSMATIFTDARERTENEFKELLGDSRWEFQKLYPFQAPYSIIEGISNS